MNWIVAVYPTVVTVIGLLDTTIILIMGIISAFLWLIDYKSVAFWERVWPATWILIGSSIAAGIVFTITRYVAVWASHV